MQQGRLHAPGRLCWLVFPGCGMSSPHFGGKPLLACVSHAVKRPCQLVFPGCQQSGVWCGQTVLLAYVPGAAKQLCWLVFPAYAPSAPDGAWESPCWFAFSAKAKRPCWFMFPRPAGLCRHCLHDKPRPSYLPRVVPGMRPRQRACRRR